MSKYFAIVIPVYNEGEAITETIGQIRNKVKGDYHIYVVYDTDDDTTLPYLKRYSPELLTTMKNKFGRGVLNALKTGFEGTKEERIVVFMADLSEDPRSINDLVARSEEGYDVVCGSRYMKGGSQTGGPFIKSFLSRMAGLSLHLLTGIPTHDISDNFRLYSRKVLDSIKIESRGGFEVAMEITVKAYLAGFKVTEVPTHWKERSHGKSNFKMIEWLPRYLHWYFYLLKGKLLGVNA